MRLFAALPSPPEPTRRRPVPAAQAPPTAIDVPSYAVPDAVEALLDEERLKVAQLQAEVRAYADWERLRLKAGPWQGMTDDEIVRVLWMKHVLQLGLRGGAKERFIQTHHTTARENHCFASSSYSALPSSAFTALKMSGTPSVVS